MTIDELNTLPEGQAWEVLLSCCGSVAWARQMASARPFENPDGLLASAGQVWQELGPADWLEAFSKHPRIGETKPIGKWSAEEQRGMNGANNATVQSITEMNEEYHRKFGWIFLVCATGKSAEEVRDLLEGRLRNEPNLELRIAMEEQAKITRIRLRKLLSL